MRHPVTHICSAVIQQPLEETQYQVEVGQRGRVLKDTNGKGAFQGQIKIWYRGISQESTKLILLRP